jgi:hypothetical protein
LSISIHHTIWLWANGYIKKESHDSAKLTQCSSIIKVKGSDSKISKIINFSKELVMGFSDVVELEECLNLEPQGSNMVDPEAMEMARVLILLVPMERGGLCGT